ncbi:MAG TPA: hypothetical protein VJQ50_04840 [Terriglobales bacterium]|nr:hypothetical protein [Terriglobales bacterium]
MSDARSRQSDRDLQDIVITYLADATVRRAPVPPLPLSPEQAERAGKFARFLARRYYRDRLARSFRYSRRFAAAAETLVDIPAFEGFLDDCVLGSAAAAGRVGDMVIDYLNSFQSPGPWWSDLLQYEGLFFLQTATTELVRPAKFPQPAASARCCRFSWNLPDLLPELKTGQPIAGSLRQEVLLLFSRTPQGRIYVVEVNDATAAVFRAADSRLSASQIADAISLSPEFVRQTLAALAQIGALVTSS